MSEKEFDIQVIARGSYLDKAVRPGDAWEIETITIRLNHVALNAWLLSTTSNVRECYDTDEEWEQHKKEYNARHEAVKAKILDALGLGMVRAERESVCITQSLSEIFTVVRIALIMRTSKPE